MHRQLATLLALTSALAVSCAPSAPPASPAGAAPAGHAMRIADLPLRGSPAFVAVTRDVLDLVVSLDPSIAASAGLFDDAVRVPSYAPARVAERVAQADRALAALKALPWRSGSVDEQIDWRWLYANVETARRQLADERMFERRPAQWLEPLANDLIALVSYAGDRPELPRRVFALVPAMLDDARAVAVKPTARDLETALRLLDALTAMATATASPEGSAAVTALGAYAAHLRSLHPAVDFAVVGDASYAWRYRHAMLLPWTPEQLLHEAEAALAAVDAQIAVIEPRLPPPQPNTLTQRTLARTLTRDALLGLYDGIEGSLREATERGSWVTVPSSVGPIHARETPDAMVPLTGDGGSMNPPPTFVASNIGFWNVEHFRDSWTEEKRVSVVTRAQSWATNGLGPYAAHEGFPGHHLQLAIARKNPDPLRSILPDGVLVEGWALYSEEALWQHGGLGDALESRHRVLLGQRHRIARVIYDVNIERGTWDLQRAADFRDGKEAGKGTVDEEILRAIQWPTQLAGYWAGKLEITRLKEEMQAKLGAHFDERVFHDALLAEGSVPIALVRAKMLGEPIPAPE